MHITSEESVLALKEGDRVMYRRNILGHGLESTVHKGTVMFTWLCMDAIMLKVKPDHEDNLIDLWHEKDIIDRI